MSTSGLSHDTRNISFLIDISKIRFKNRTIHYLFTSETRGIFPRGECFLSLDDESDGV